MSGGDNKVSVEISTNAFRSADNHEAIQLEHLRTYPAMAKCVSCNTPSFSRVERSINWLNFLFCFCCSPCWNCYMVYKWKDMNCFNANHSCSHCGKEINQYTSC